MTPVDRSAVGRRSARVGKAGELGVLKALRAHGFPMAEPKRVEAADRLDINVCPGVIASVKAGAYAKDASLLTLAEWRREAIEKRDRIGADVVLLIVQRKGYSSDPERVMRWRAWIPQHPIHDGWEAELGRVLEVLRREGYGEAL